MKAKTLDQIKPIWFRRLVMICISPFMIFLMVAMLILMCIVAAGCMIVEPSSAKQILHDYWYEVLGGFAGSIKYWHVDIWNGNTIRTVAPKNVDEHASL